MNASIIKTLAVGALCAVSSASFATTYNGSCTAEPVANWLSPDAVKAKIVQQGYSVARVKSSGTCYEVYTRDKNGNRVELFVNPANASVVGRATR